MPKPRVLLRSWLACALLLMAGPGRADEEPLDQPAIDCAVATVGNDYVGGDFARHAAAAAIWSECVIGLHLVLEERYQDKLDRSPPGSEFHTLYKRLVKTLGRDLKRHALVVDAAQALEEFSSAEQGARLLKRMHTKAYMTSGSVLESTQQAYSHAAQASALFRVGVERQLDERVEALVAVTAQSAARFRKKGAKFALVAAAVSADLDSIESDVLSALTTVAALQAQGLTGKEKRAAILVATALEKLIRRYHAGIRVLLKLDAKLEKQVQKAERAAEQHPDPDSDPDPDAVQVSVVDSFAAFPSPARVREQVDLSVTLDLLPAEEYFQSVIEFGDGSNAIVSQPSQGGELVRDNRFHRYFAPGFYEATVTVSWLKGFATGVFGISEPVEVFTETITVEIIP